MSNRPDTVKGYLTHVIRVGGVLVDVDGYATTPKIRLRISVVEPTQLAGTVYSSSSAYPTMNTSADDIAVRTQKGVYSFYDITATEHVIADSTLWRKTDDPAGPLQPGYVYDFEWCYTVDGQSYIETIRRAFDEEGRDLTPATHTYTFAGLKSLTRQFLGNTDPGTDSLSNIVNEAVFEVWSAHPWSFIQTDSLALDTIAGLEYVDLPPDFLRLESLEATDNLVHRMVKVSGREMRAIRERAVSLGTNVTYFYINFNSTRNRSSLGNAKLEICPTPTETQPGFYTMDYARLPPAMSQDNDYPPLPLGLFPLLKQACRMVAAETEGREEAEMERGRFEKMLPRYVTMDEKRRDDIHLGPLNSPIYPQHGVLGELGVWGPGVNPDPDLSGRIGF